MFILKIILLFIPLLLTHIEIIKNIFEQNASLFCILLLFFLFLFIFAKNDGKTNFTSSSFCFFIFPFVLNLFNTFFIHSFLMAKISLVFGIFGILNLFLDRKFSNFVFWSSLIFCLLLPVKEYFQIFLGTPIRLFAADFFENLFSVFKIKINAFDSILVFENSITNVDYPCSGNLTVYYSILFMFVISFLKNLKPSFLVFLKIFVCVFIAIFLNIFRIFLLILLSLLNFNFLFDAFHTLFGAINYIIICILFYFLTTKRNGFDEIKSELVFKKINTVLFLPFFFMSLILSIPVYFKNDIKTSSIKFEIVEKEGVDNLEFSLKELSFFKKHGSKIQKYKYDDKIIFKITANGFLGVHNPILCLKSQGFKILDSTVIFDKGNSIRFLKTGNGFIYYCFKKGDIITDDYYTVSFRQIFSDNKEISLFLLHSPVELENSAVLKFFDL